MFKNVASQTVTLYAVDASTGLPKTGDSANMLFYVSKDDGTVTLITAASGVPTEVDSTNGKGTYKIALAQAETNADKLLFTGKSSTSNVVVVPAVIYTTPNRFSSMVIDAAGLSDANMVKAGPTGAGTAQTARDIGASVLLSTGTGTGQLDFTAGVVKSNLAQILGTALTETAGQIAAAFKKFFDKATPTGTVNSLPDAVAGAASGLAIVGSNVGAATSVSGAVGSVTGAVGSVTGNVGGIAGVTIPAVLPDGAHFTAARGDKLDNLDATVSSRNAVAPPSTGAIAAAVMGDVSDTVGADIVLIKAKTDNLPASPAAVSNIPTAVQVRQEIDSNSTQLALIEGHAAAADTASAALPSAAAILAAIKADTEWKTILGNVNGCFAFNATTKVLVLKDKANAVTLATLTLTEDGSGNITARASS